MTGPGKSLSVAGLVLAGLTPVPQFFLSDGSPSASLALALFAVAFGAAGLVTLRKAGELDERAKGVTEISAAESPDDARVSLNLDSGINPDGPSRPGELPAALIDADIPRAHEAENDIDEAAMAVYDAVLPHLFSSIVSYLNATSEPMSETLVRIKSSISEFVSRVSESKKTYEADAGANGVKDGVHRLREHITEVTRVNAASCDEVASEIRALDGQMMSILDLVGSISDVAERIHVLSINASIEAARAGANGRGFKVIADEVQRLSRETQTFVQTIGKTVSSTQNAFSSLHGIMDKNKKDVDRFVFDDASTYQAISDTLDRQLTGVMSLYAAVLDFIKSLDMDMTAFAPIGMLHAIITQEIENLGRVASDLTGYRVATAERLENGIGGVRDVNNVIDENNAARISSEQEAIDAIRARLTTSRELDALESALRESGIASEADLKRTNTVIEFF